jgi:hypothetical protein
MLQAVYLNHLISIKGCYLSTRNTNIIDVVILLNRKTYHIAIIVCLHNPYQLIVMIYNNVNRGPCPIQGNEIGLTWLMFIDRLISKARFTKKQIIFRMIWFGR